MLFVGFVAPHFPLIAPQRYVDLYPPDKMPLPKMQRQNGYVRHPWLDAQETFMPTDVEFGVDDEKRRQAISAYYALCTMMNDHVGAICAALDDTGLARATSVIYTSDHGEALGQRGHWGKSSLYGECTQSPRHHWAGRTRRPRLRHPGQSRRSCADVPLRLRSLGFELPGRSLFEIAHQPSDQDDPASRSITRSALRPVHLCCGKAAGSTTSMSVTTRAV